MPVQTNIRDARAELDRWGRWWRGRESGESHTRQSRTSVAHDVMEVARVGIRAPSTRGFDADSIRPPFWVQILDEAVEQLPQAQRAAVAAFYLRRSLSKRNRAVLRAEIALSDML